MAVRKPRRKRCQRRQKSQRPHRLRFETLESRHLLAAISYVAIGNVPIDVPVEEGLLAGTTGVTVVDLDDSATTGVVDLQPDGSFRYTPATGFLGIDTFTIERSDGQMPSVAVDVGNAIWFVDQSATAGGDGSVDAPLQSLAPLNTGGSATDKPGDLIFINGGDTYDVAHASGFEVEFGQTIVTSWSDPFGQPQFMEEIHFPLVPFSEGNLPRGFTARPQLVNSVADAPVLRVSGDNFISSFDIQPAADGDAVTGQDVGGFLFLHNMQVIPGPGDHSYDVVSLQNSSVHLDFYDFVIGNFQDSSTSGTAIKIEGGDSVQLTAHDNTRSFQIGGGLLSVTGTTGGSSVVFDETTSLGISFGDFGFDLQNNTGGAAFEFAGEFYLLDVVSGITAINSGRIETPLGAGPLPRVVDGFGGTALHLENVDSGDDGIHLDNVLSIGGVHGVHIDNVSGAGVFIGSTEVEDTSGVAIQVLNSPGVEFSFGTTLVTGSDFDIDTIVGTGVAGSAGDDGSADAAQLDTTAKIATDRKGNLFIADRGAHTIRRVDAVTGVITTIAGNGTAGFSGDDSAAVDAQLNEPKAVAIDDDGNVFIADAGNHRIRRVDAETGLITTIAGTGAAAFTGDGGPAHAAALNSPADVTFDTAGNLLIADELNHAVRRIDTATGIITTLVGTGVAGISPEDTPPATAQLNMPRGIVWGSNEQLAIADAGNHRVVGVDFDDDTVFTMIGTGSAGNNGTETENSLGFELDSPDGLALHPRGIILINDANNHRVVAFTPTFTAGSANVIAGTGAAGFSGDGGPAPLAELNHPSHVAVGGRGEIFIADSGNHRVRRIELGYNPSEGILLDHNPGSTISFDSFEVHATGFGLLADDNGIVNIGQSHFFAGLNAIVDTRGGPALDVERTTLGNGLGDGATFRNVSSFGSPTDGIILRELRGDLTIDSGLIVGANQEGLPFTAGIGIEEGSDNITIHATVVNTMGTAVLVTGRTGGDIHLITPIHHNVPGTSAVVIEDNLDGSTTLCGPLNVDSGAAPPVVENNNGNHVVTFLDSCEPPEPPQPPAGPEFFDSGQLLGNLSFDSSHQSTGVDLGDLDGDGDLDAFVTNLTSELDPPGLDDPPTGAPNRVYFNTNGIFVDSGQSLGDLPSGHVQLGDFDADGDLDAFVANFGSNQVWLNDGDGAFNDSGQQLGDGLSFTVALGDLDDDGDLDAVVANVSDLLGGGAGGEVWINQGLHSGTFVNQATNIWDEISAQGVALGDVDNDGDLDALLVQNQDEFEQAGRELLLLNQGDGTFIDSGQDLGVGFGLAAVLEDFDSDGDLDAFVTGAREFPPGSEPDGVRAPNRYFVNQGGAQGGTVGVFAAPVEIFNDNQDQSRVDAADLDGDGDIDVFVANVKDNLGSADGQNRVYVNQGGLQGGVEGTILDNGQQLGSSHTIGVALGDVNGDGAIDAFVTNGGSPSRVWLNGVEPPIVVNSTADPGDGTCDANECTLREALLLADNGGGSVVTFQPSLAGQTITLTAGEIFIDSDVEILGLGAGNLTISGANSQPIFFVEDGNEVFIADLTLADGFRDQFGGAAIYSLGDLTVSRTVFSNNAAEYGSAISYEGAGTLVLEDSLVTGGTGSAIDAYGSSLTILRSTITDNHTDAVGGGLEVGEEVLTATIIDSTIADNSAAFAGGILNVSPNMLIERSTISGNSTSGSFTPEGTGVVLSGGGGIATAGNLTVVNSTFSGNSTDAAGGAIQVAGIPEFGLFGTTTITNATFLGNSAAAGGGISTDIGTDLVLQNSIVTASTGGDVQIEGTASGSHNLIDDAAPSLGRIGAVTNLDANLADNGGLTLTHALLAGSNAIDASDNALAVGSNDQRGDGFVRIFNTTADIGAFEFDPSSLPANEPPSADAGGPYSIVEGQSIRLDGSGSSDDHDTAGQLAVLGLQPGALVYEDGRPGGSVPLAISGNGQFVAYRAAGTELGAGFNSDVIGLTNLTTGISHLVSLSGARLHNNEIPFAVSFDGRYVAYVPNNSLGVVVHHVSSGIDEYVSIDGNGNLAPGIPTSPSMSSDGRFVTFTSYAALLDEDTDDRDDIYLRDRVNDVTELISVDAVDHAGYATISGNGRVVAYLSDTDIYIYDRDTAETTVIEGPVYESVSLTEDGRSLIFQSSTAYVDDDTNESVDFYAYDRVNGDYERISVDFDASKITNGGWDFSPAISADGRYFAFASTTDQFGLGSFSGVYVHDRHTGHTTPVSTTIEGVGPRFDGSGDNASAIYPSISADGSRVAFYTQSDNLIDFAGCCGIAVANIGIQGGGSAGGNGLLTFEWDLDYDGENFDVDQTGVSPTVSFDDNFAERTIALRVTDSGGLSDISTTTLTVTNADPVVDAGADQAGDEGSTFSFSGSFTDAGAADTHTFVWEFGDGATNTTTLTPTHVYTQPGEYTVTLTVTDDDGASTTDQLTVTVIGASAAPDVPVDDDPATNRVVEGAANGTTVGITAFSTDPDGDTVTYRLTDDADGRFSIDPNSGVVTVANGDLLDFETAISHTITVVADDGHGGTSTAEFTVQVTDVNETFIIDNRDPAPAFVQSGFTNYGTATFQQPQGFRGNIHYLRGSSPAGTARWTFTGLPTGIYRVSATWFAHGNRATDSPFKVYDGGVDASPDAQTNLNQQLAPNDFNADGADWEDILGGIQITGDTLTVTLDNAIGDPSKHVIADAVRIERVNAAADIEVRGAAGSIVQTSIDLGTTLEGGVARQTITIKNVGPAQLDLGTLAVSGDDQFSLDTTGHETTLAAGQSTSFVVVLDTATAGNFSGQVTILSNDPDESSVAFNVTGVINDTLVIDNRDPAAKFVQTGFTNYGTASFQQSQGYLGNIHYLQGSSPAGKATWTFTGLPEGFYKVSATWFAHSNRATDSPFKVFDGAADVSPDAAANLNQQLAPNDLTDAGVGWEDISGGLLIDSGTLTVTLDNAISNASKYVIADAVRIQRIDDLGAEIELRDAANHILTSGGGLDLGTVLEGSTTRHTVTIKNVGGARLDLGAITAGGMNFSVNTAGLDTVLEPGESTTFDIVLDTAMAGSFIGTVRIPSLAPHADADENPFTIDVTAAVNDIFVVDNRDVPPAFTAPGFTNYGLATFEQPQGYRGNIHYLRGSSLASKATFTFTGLSAGSYLVSATWFAHNNRATDSPFKVFDGADDGMPDASVTLNQQLSPNDLQYDGVGWEDIAIVQVTGSTLTVTVNNAISDTSKYVIADAVRIERLSALEAAVGPESSLGGAVASLDAALVSQAVASAVADWSRLDASAAAKLAGVGVEIADLPGNVLGLASESTSRIWIDSNAAGYGWNVSGETRDKSQEQGSFASGPRPSTLGPRPHIDLLTVVTHELGHVLGLPDLDAALHVHDVMSGRLDVGVRRLPLGFGIAPVSPSTAQTALTSADRLFAGLGGLIDGAAGDESSDNGSERRDESAVMIPGELERGGGSALEIDRLLNDEEELFAGLTDRRPDRRDEESADQLFAELFDEPGLRIEN